jgi:hypothetical protein
MSIQDPFWTNFLEKKFSFKENGAIDWSLRPYSKSWSLQRLGFEGGVQLIESFISLKELCWWATSHSEEFQQKGIQEVLKRIAKTPYQEHHWLINTHQKWIIEISQDQRLSIEMLQGKAPELVPYKNGKAPKREKEEEDEGL